MGYLHEGEWAKWRVEELRREAEHERLVRELLRQRPSRWAAIRAQAQAIWRAVAASAPGAVRPEREVRSGKSASLR